MNRQSSPAFEQLSDRNHGPLIILATYVFLGCSCLSVSIKLWLRMSSTRKLALTDWVMLIALACAIAQAVTLTLSVNQGLGRHTGDLSVPQVESASKAYYASSILMLATLAAAKASVTLLIISIQPSPPVLRACNWLLSVTGVWMFAGSLALAFQCELPEPWLLASPHQCVNQYGLQIGLGVFNILTDIGIVVLAFSMMRNVQVSMARKSTVVALFGLRIATPPFTICALIAYSAYYNSQPLDCTWHVVSPAIWNQVMLNISIITACVPSIKRFFADVQSGLMGVTISEQYELTHSGGKATPLASTNGTGIRSKTVSQLSTLSDNIKSIPSRHFYDGRSGLQPIERARKYGSVALVKGGQAIESQNDTESIKGLTQNVIHQKVDYKIEYEDRSTELSGDRSSPVDCCEGPRTSLDIRR